MGALATIEFRRIALLVPLSTTIPPRGGTDPLPLRLRTLPSEAPSGVSTKLPTRLPLDASTSTPTPGLSSIVLASTTLPVVCVRWMPVRQLAMTLPCP